MSQGYLYEFGVEFSNVLLNSLMVYIKANLLKEAQNFTPLSCWISVFPVPFRTGTQFPLGFIREPKTAYEIS